MRTRLLVITVCGAGLVSSAPAAPPATMRPVASGLDAPVDIAGLPGDPDRLLVLERAGRVRVVTVSTGQVASLPFLDFSASVCCAAEDGGAQGICLAPDYAISGHFYVCSTAAGTGDSTVTRYTVSTNPLVADAGSAHPVLHYPRPIYGHDGGWIGFGPEDGLLYISTGDGGEALNPDPYNAAQTITNQLMGKILRVDPRADDFPTDASQNYSIPPGNPFVVAPGDDEIWAYGLRNPWRCAFDPVTGDFYIADVGQDAWEEINVQSAGAPGGANYGWRCMEATGCTGLSGCVCDAPSLTSPAHQYPHTYGCSITGGVVYRGTAIPQYQGRYFFADFCTDRVWSLKMAGGAATDLREHTAEFHAGQGFAAASVATFGTDAAGEMYLADYFGGTIYAVVPRCLADFDGDTWVNGVDFDSFVDLFWLGDPGADIDGNTFVNGDDFDSFVDSFFAGC